MKRAVCDHCRTLCEDEVYRFSHEYPGEPVDASLTFCSMECVYEHFDVVPYSRSEEEVKKEANLLHKQVCPACRRRIRDRVE